MDIFFQAKNIELVPAIKEHMAQRIYGLNKFFSPYAKAYIDVEKTRSSRNGADLYYTSISIQDGKFQYFTEDYQDDVRKSFDHTYGEIFSIIRNDRSKSRKLAKKAGTRIKKLFRLS